MAAGRGNDPRTAEPAITISHGIEIEWKIFGGSIGHHTQAIKRNPRFSCNTHNAGRFHFHGT